MMTPVEIQLLNILASNKKSIPVIRLNFKPNVFPIQNTQKIYRI